MRNEKTKVVVVVGPTASGKTSLAISLAKHHNGEVISADSRQVYRGLDLGTGKVTAEEMDGVPHHLLDVTGPDEVFSAADFVRGADEAIADITTRGKLPIIAGGTFFYIEALLGTKTLAKVPANTTLRTALEHETTENLFKALEEKDPAYANTADRRNRHRLIRALEVIDAYGSMPAHTPEARYNALIIGIETESVALNEKIDVRLRERLDAGMLEEARILHTKGLSYDRMESLGLEYRYMARHLQGELSYDEMATVLEHKIHQYAKRQRTWLKKMENVTWFSPTDAEKVEPAVKNFLQN